jgi:DNA replication protein DnaC
LRGQVTRGRFSTCYINGHTLIEQLKEARFENRLQDRLKIFSRYRLLIIDEIAICRWISRERTSSSSLSPGAMKRL